MQTCEHCKNPFPSSVVIDGKRRNLGHRKYCFDCSPFGAHRTRPVGYTALTQREHTCPICKRLHFNRCAKCGSCCANLRRFRIKQKAVHYLGDKCKICGYNKCLDALHFHHRNPSQKDFQIGGSHCRNWSAIRAELDKCDLVCANCHAEIHAKREQSNYGTATITESGKAPVS